MNRRVRGRPNPRMMINQMKKQLTGGKITPRVEPPSFVQAPWNSYTFEATNVTEAAFETTTITSDNVIAQLRSRFALLPAPIGETDGAVVTIKIQKVQVWATVADTLLQPDINVFVFELSEATAAQQAVRFNGRDLGTLNRPAKVGYEFPINDSRDILGGGATRINKTIVSTEAVALGTPVTTRLKILWKSEAQSVLPPFLQQ